MSGWNQLMFFYWLGILAQDFPRFLNGPALGRLPETRVDSSEVMNLRETSGCGALQSIEN